MRRMEPLDKSGWRRQIRELLRAFPAEARAVASLQLREILSAQSVWSAAARVLCFAPLPDEPDITPLLNEALRKNKTVAFPRFDPARGCYVAAHLATRLELVPGAFGVLEPGPGCPAIPLNQLDLILVPGVAFDLAGRRLGRGKGFYDRLLAEVRGHKCGVAFDMQLVAELPEEPHDVRVDSILTPTRWLSACAD
jgi:5-formyltetrahydrofolate cyclo-ligase